MRESAGESAGESRHDWKLSLTVGLGTLFIRALARTWRFRLTNDETYKRMLAEHQPFIFAFWHGQLFPLLWLHRGQCIAIVVSAHRDGELVARVAERLGLRTIRGSSTRGAARALLGVVRELEDGGHVAMTPDGPRGPAQRFATGALVAAQRVGAPIIAIGVSAPRSWRLRSWDRFMIPKPFARVNVAYSLPTPVDVGSAREAEAEAPRFEALIGEAIATAERA